MIRRVFLPAILVLLSLPFAVAQQKDQAPLPQIASDFTLTDLEGHKFSLSDFKGKVVLLDFWATWCVPCQTEIPKFIEWQKQYGPQGLQILGISMDDDEPPVREFQKRFLFNYPVAMGTEHVAELYGGVMGLPANFIIGRDGKIYARHVGLTELNLIENELKKQLEAK